MGLEVLGDETRAADALRQQLRLTQDTARGSLFELVRTIVWSVAASDTKAHVHRVLSTALLPWQLLSPRQDRSEETLRLELREALSMLEDAGDLIGMSGGYWAPAAARLVLLPHGAGWVLIGGIPCALLALEGDVVQFHGPHRRIAVLPEKLAGTVPQEAFKSWARLPELPLLDWAREVFNSIERLPYEPSSADAFDFYVPASAKAGTPQFFRWSESAADRTGTLLARRRRLYGAREYRLVDVRAGRIVRACELHDVDVRRLMYALALEAKNPVRACPTRLGGQTEWLFGSELPRAEQRAFAAFGSLTIPDERRFERRWTFMHNEELALDMLRSLGIAVVQPRGVSR